jgi:hypothetical protein
MKKVPGAMGRVSLASPISDPHDVDGVADHVVGTALASECPFQNFLSLLNHLDSKKMEGGLIR